MVYNWQGQNKKSKILEHYQGDYLIFCPNWEKFEGIGNCFGMAGISQHHLGQIKTQGGSRICQNKVCDWRYFMNATDKCYKLS